MSCLNPGFAAQPENIFYQCSRQRDTNTAFTFDDEKDASRGGISHFFEMAPITFQKAYPQLLFSATLPAHILVNGYHGSFDNKGQDENELGLQTHFFTLPETLLTVYNDIPQDTSNLCINISSEKR